MKLIKVIHHLFWNKDDSSRNEAEMFRKIARTGTKVSYHDYLKPASSRFQEQICVNQP